MQGYERDLSSWTQTGFALAYKHEAEAETAELVPTSLFSQDLLAPLAQDSSILLDPLSQFCMQTRTPFVWEEELTLGRTGTLVQRSYSNAPDHEPAPAFGNEEKTFSGLRARVRYAGPQSRYDEDASRELRMLGAILHQRINVLHQAVLKRRRALYLTEREQETLKWGALGKTSDDIGQILGLTKRTVDQHFENAGRKLDTYNRVQTVVKAYRLGLIAV